MGKPVRVRDAPGLVWKKRRNDVFEARWQCRTDIVAKGFTVKSVKLWTGTGEPTTEEWDFSHHYSWLVLLIIEIIFFKVETIFLVSRSVALWAFPACCFCPHVLFTASHFN